MQIYKRPDEINNVQLDFADDAGAGNAIAFQSLQSWNLLDGTDSTAEIIAGSPAVIASTQQVGFTVRNGAPGERHRIEVRVTAASGETFQGEVYLDVIAGL